MKVKIISSVIIDGRVVEPGTEKPTIVDVDEKTAENLYRIGCAIDPEKSDIPDEVDLTKELTKKVKELEAINEQLDKHRNAGNEKIKALETQLKTASTKIKNLTKINNELLEANHIALKDGKPETVNSEPSTGAKCP